MEPKPILPVAMMKQECDEDDVIDLDKYVSIRKEAEEWDSKVRSHLRDMTSFESERKLDSMMKWYIESLKNEATLLTDHILVQSYIIKHLYTFKACLIQLDYCYVDNYLDNMEEIMTFYSNLALKLLPKWRPEKSLKKQINQMCRKLIYYIKLYLLCREDRALHVLMKMRVNQHSKECKDFMNHLYRAVLRREPKEKTDLAFCRAYILFQQWKKIKDKTCWKALDELMYALFDRSAQDIKTNGTLKRVILPQHNSILDALAHIDNDNVIMVREYFKIIQPDNIQDINDSQTDLELDVGINLGSDETEEDPDLEEYYINYRKSMALVPRRNLGELKEENDSDGDCQFVGVVNNAPEIIHEIPDDDDIVEVVIFKENTTVPCKKKSDVDCSDLAFFDTISLQSEHDAAESQTSDEQIRRPSDSPVLGVEIDSWIGEKENYHNQDQKVNSTQQSAAKHKIGKNLSNLLTPFSDDMENEKVMDVSKAGSEAVVESFTENKVQPITQKNITGKRDAIDISPVALQSKDISAICETSYSTISGGTSYEKQCISSKEKLRYVKATDRIPRSTPTIIGTDTSPHMSSNSSNMSEFFINSPSSSNLPNHTPNRNEDPYASPNCPDISSTIEIQEESVHYTEGSEQFLETEQNTRSEKSTSRESITQSHLDDANYITIEYPSLINDKEFTTIGDNDDDKAAPAPEMMEPSCSTATDTIQEHVTKGAELSVILEKINIRPSESMESKKLENKIMYTQRSDASESDFCKLNSHKTWQNMKNTHELDNIMSGPVENYVSGAALPERDFDLFDYAGNTTNPDMQTTPIDIRSPQEGLDDFINYFGEKVRRNTLAISEVHRNLPSISNPENNQRRLILKKIDYLKETEKPDAPKVKRVTFAEKPIIHKEKSRMLISKKEMNMRSFKAAGIKPTDRNLQSIPVVIVEKLEKWEIEQWLKMSETSRRLRMEKERLQALQTHTLQNTMFKIDYDKTEVSLTQQEVEQLQNNFLGRDNNLQGTEVVNKSSAMVNKSAKGMVEASFNKTSKNNLEETFSSSSCDNEIDFNLYSTDSSLNCNYSVCQNTDSEGCGNSKQPEYTYMTNFLGNSRYSFVNNEQFNVEYSRKLVSPIFDENNTKPISTLENVKTVSKMPMLEELSPSFSSFSNSPTDNLLSEYVSDICQSEHLVGQEMFNPDKCGSALQEVNYIALNNMELSTEENVDLGNEPHNHFDLNSTLPKLDEGGKVCLPLKKRKLSAANNDEEYFLGPDIVEEIIKQARLEEFTGEEAKEEISYPAKPMISIAEIQEELKKSPPPRAFKTPAEKKEMPPPPLPKQTEEVPQQHGSILEQPKIVAEQYNNHTYNNPTINYHMNNLPYTFFPYAGLQYFPQIILPMSGTQTFDVNTNFDVKKQFDINIKTQPQAGQYPPNPPQDAQSKPKERKKGRGRKKC